VHYNKTKRRIKQAKKILKRDSPNALRIIKGKTRNGRGGRGVLLITILRPEVCYQTVFVDFSFPVGLDD